MKVEHNCSFKTLSVPFGVSQVIEIKRCPECGQWWKRTSYRGGGYSMSKVISRWPNVRLVTYRRRARKLLG